MFGDVIWTQLCKTMRYANSMTFFSDTNNTFPQIVFLFVELPIVFLCDMLSHHSQDDTHNGLASTTTANCEPLRRAIRT